MELRTGSSAYGAENLERGEASEGYGACRGRRAARGAGQARVPTLRGQDGRVPLGRVRANSRGESWKRSGVEGEKWRPVGMKDQSMDLSSRLALLTNRSAATAAATVTG
jgi:hypothetical protein